MLSLVYHERYEGDTWLPREIERPYKFYCKVVAHLVLKLHSGVESENIIFESCD